MTTKKLRIILIFCTIILFVCLTIWKLIQREHYMWDEIVKFHNGKIVKVHNHYSNYKEYGGRHGFSIGLGYKPWNKIWFEFEGIKHKWENKYTPVLLDEYNKNLYLVALDREIDRNKMNFRFFRNGKKWREITIKEFPKSIALQNMWLSEDNGYFEGKIINEYQIVEDLEPTDFLFKKSLTAKIWLCLERGIRYSEAPDLIDERFLVEFKQKYIKKETIKSNSNLMTNKKVDTTGFITKYNGIIFALIMMACFVLVWIFIVKVFIWKMEKKKAENILVQARNYIPIILMVSFIYYISFDVIATLLSLL